MQGVKDNEEGKKRVREMIVSSYCRAVLYGPSVECIYADRWGIDSMRLPV